MFSECANPDCRAEFDYHEGRFYRFYKPRLDDGPPDNTHGVVHFWLCGRCSLDYSLDYVDGVGTLIRVPFEHVFANRNKSAGVFH
ncbi:MAG: hypothetical protein WCE52_07190 [Candidatus Acidiferrum sp.]